MTRLSLPRWRLRLSLLGLLLLLGLTAYPMHAAPYTATPAATQGGPDPSLAPAAASCTSGTWQLLAPYPITITDAAVAALGDAIYSFGGATTDPGRNGPIADAYHYQPGSGWTPLAPLPEIRQSASAVSDGRYLYILGGYYNDWWDSFYRYDPETDSYATLPLLPHRTANTASVYLDGRIYRIGGGHAGPDNTVDVYTVSTNTWAPWGTVAPLPQPTVALMAVAYEGQIFVAGGYTNHGELTKTYRYDPASNTWNDAGIPDLPQPRAEVASGVVDGRWMLTGWEAGNSTTLAWQGPAGMGWCCLPAMPVPLSHVGSAGIGTALYVVGGWSDADQRAHTEFQRYTAGPCSPTGATAATTPVR